MKIPFVVVSASISLALWGCGGDDDTTEAPPPAPPAGPGTIVQTAQNTPALSLLVAALEAAELVATFNDPAANFTVFAPTDDAFTRALEDSRFKLLLDNKTLLTYVLQQHVINGGFQSGDLTNGVVWDSLNTEAKLVITLSGGNVTVRSQVLNKDDDPNATVSMPDVVCSNGVVHIVDSVIVPRQVENIVQYSERNDTDGSIFARLVSENGLVKTLTGVGPFTVFAPRDSAWNESEFNTRYATEELRSDALQFHVKAGITLISDLPEGNTNLTMFNGKVLRLNKVGRSVTFLTPNSGSVQFFVNYHTTNGVIYLVDTVLEAEPPAAGLVLRELE